MTETNRDGRPVRRFGGVGRALALCGLFALLFGGCGALVGTFSYFELSDGPLPTGAPQYCLGSDAAKLVQDRLPIYLALSLPLQWVVCAVGVVLGARKNRSSERSVDRSGHKIALAASAWVCGAVAMWAAHGRDIRSLLGADCTTSWLPHRWSGSASASWLAFRYCSQAARSAQGSRRQRETGWRPERTETERISFRHVGRLGPHRSSCLASVCD